MTAVEAENAVIGLSVGSDETDYVMAMNKNRGPDVPAEERQTIVLHLAPDLQKVTPVGQSASSSKWSFDAEPHALKCEAPASPPGPDVPSKWEAA